MRYARKLAFTLLELLVVLAITAVMMTLIIIPVVQSFNLMRAGQGFSDAQHKAAQLVESIGREISNAAAVRDNSGIKGTIAVYVPGPGATGQQRVLLPYSKIDLLKPAEGEPMRGPSGALINPVTGREDPTLRAPKGQVVLPVSQGSTLVRYFIALRNPGQPYNNPYDGLLMARNPNRDNLYVLYRAEVQPWIYSPTLNRFVVNKSLFYDLNRDGSTTTSGPWYDDPDFFNLGVPLPIYTNPDPSPGAPADPTKAQMVQNWMRHATIVTEVSRYDMIQPIFNKANRQVTYDGNVPRIFALVQFKPATMSSEPAEAMTALRLSEETEGMAALGADVFRTKMGAWSNVLIRLWPNGWLPSDPNLNDYEVGRRDPNTPGLSVYYFNPDLGGLETNSGTELFDIDEYLRSRKDGVRYPFQRAITEANLRSAWSSNTSLRNGFMPFYPQTGTGKLITSFGVDEWGFALGTLTSDPETPFPNTNVAHMNTGPALTPTNDTALGGNFFDAQYAPNNSGGVGCENPASGSSINKLFNKVWADNPGMRPHVHRFIDLRLNDLRDGTASLLNPDPSLGFARTRIVPGSEIVIGPDQNPGPNYGKLIRYTRTTRSPGPNQYRINYTDIPEPMNPGANPTDPSDDFVDYGMIGFPNPPAVYTPTDFTSAIIQPRYKAGYLQLNSDPNVPLPEDDPSTTPLNEGNVSVFYRFQMTIAGDTVAVDYDTSQLLQVLLTVKNFPQTTLPNAQSVTLKATATVRNILR